MKLEVGMYARTKSGEIGKIRVIIDNMFFINENQYYSTILKASYNIIDLIEVGDYVNGQRVNYINKDSDYFTFKFGSADYTLKSNFNSDNKYLAKEDIKSIVTKEQFESCMYKVGE